MGTVMRATIHELCTSVSPSFARYTCSQSTGVDCRRSRSLARKNDDSAVMTLESSRIERNDSKARPSSLPARSGPMSSTPRK
ncbi:MAG: hypothetical protein A2W29_03005 [Gemmatimonadetes bacterium RBG_16_66_8]|nr:MAG: hypothetical protein A2W29_03005 [Gemmatimonadetes bacterium RBG_16_66_8]